MNQNINGFISKPPKSVEEFAAKEVYISERLNEQQQPPAKSWLVLWRFLTSLFTAAVISGVIIAHELMEANQLNDRAASAPAPAVAAAVSVPAPEPTPKENYFAQFRIKYLRTKGPLSNPRTSDSSLHFPVRSIAKMFRFPWVSKPWRLPPPTLTCSSRL